MELQAAAELLAERFLDARRIAVLSGAGMSAESGIPTFRSGPNALWRGIRPEDIATPEAFARDPAFVWRWYRERLQRAAQASPNPGHVALASLEPVFDSFTVITQNVDGLHAAAGSRDVIELHGNVRRARCVGCTATVLAPAGGPLPPLHACGAALRPDVVWFGELLPEGAFERAADAARRSQVFVVAGTSGQVQPAAGLADVAAAAKSFVVEINPEATPLSERCDLWVRANSGAFLPRVAAIVLAARASAPPR